jgi:uncharacterized membrane protein YhaH (DUF805 family)
VLGIVGSVAAVTMLRDPHVPGSLGMCPSLLLFGVSCPGCGSLRGIHDLVTGDVSAAVGHNLLLIPALLFVVAWAVWALRLPWLAPRLAVLGRRWRDSRAARLPIVWGVLVVILSFAVLRNLPGSPLAP